MTDRFYEVYLAISRFIVFLSVSATLLILGAIVVTVLFYGLDCLIQYISKESFIVNSIRQNKDERDRRDAKRCFRGMKP